MLVGRVRDGKTQKAFPPGRRREGISFSQVLGAIAASVLLESNRPESQFRHSLILWPWASYLTLSNINILIHRVRINKNDISMLFYDQLLMVHKFKLLLLL